MSKASYFSTWVSVPMKTKKNFQTGNHISQKPLAAQTKAPLRTFPRKFAAIFQISRTNKFPKYASTPIEFLSLGIAYRKLDIHRLFLLWDNPSFQALCDCGNIAVVTRFCGSPLSGNISATAACPHCKKIFPITNRDLKTETSFLKLTKLAASFEKNSPAPAEKKTASDNPQTLSGYAETHPDFEILINRLRAINFYAERGKTLEEAWSGWTKLDRGTYFFTTGHSLNENEDFFKQETVQLQKDQPQRQMRRHKLFLKNLPLLFKYRNWIESTLAPKALSEPDAREINGNRIDIYSSNHHDWTENSEFFFDSTPIDFLSFGGFRKMKFDLRHLFLLWENPSFQALCDCGNTAVVTGFCGISPLSGNISAIAVCPHCRKAIRITTFRACNYALKKSATFSQLYFPMYDAEKTPRFKSAKPPRRSRPLSPVTFKHLLCSKS